MFAKVSYFSPSVFQVEVIVRQTLAAIATRESRLHHVERNVDVAPCSVGICTCRLVRGVHNGLGDFPLQARQADVKPCLEEVNVARIAQVDFDIDGYVRRKFDLHLAGYKSHRTNETGRPPSGKQLLRIGTSSCDSGGRELDI